ncbi:hypothetical protein MMC09_004252 [Bachmanniomyces sp. S44760]|nr:hypothetical protein [Bachmanniomyces sp. S44760]
MGTYSFITLDVFTTDRFKGNPLGLVNVPRGSSLNQQQKQSIAKEFNLSETVFLHEDDGSPEGRRTDIFTTLGELPFAGHPTIGTLCFVGQSSGAGESKTQKISLKTKAGSIHASYDHGSGIAEAEIPHDVHVHQHCVRSTVLVDVQPDLEKTLGRHLGTTFPIVSIVRGMTFILVELPNVSPSLESLQGSQRAIPPEDCQFDEGWSTSYRAPYFYSILSRETSTPLRIRTRMIEAGFGEDPATGSAACTLASYLSLKAGGPAASFDYEIEQGVEMGRRSDIRVQVHLDDSGERVKRVILSGRSVQVMRGTLQV